MIVNPFVMRVWLRALTGGCLVHTDTTAAEMGMVRYELLELLDLEDIRGAPFFAPQLATTGGAIQFVRLVPFDRMGSRVDAVAQHILDYQKRDSRPPALGDYLVSREQRLGVAAASLQHAWTEFLLDPEGAAQLVQPFSRGTTQSW